MKAKALAVLVLIIIGFVGYNTLHHKNTATTSSSSSSSTAGETKNTFDKKQYSINDPASIWVVVNKKRPLNPKTYAPDDLAAVGNGQYMRSAAATALGKMAAAAKTAGYTLAPESGYRSYDTQVQVYNNELRAFGQSYADTESARPGYSEHQTGWAIDLGSGGCNITDCFGSTPGGRWATANAYKYGFMLRYPTDKVAITGYRHETWHFRYVGITLATELHNEHVETLEEFFGLGAAADY